MKKYKSWSEWLVAMLIVLVLLEGFFIINYSSDNEGNLLIIKYLIIGVAILVPIIISLISINIAKNTYVLAENKLKSKLKGLIRPSKLVFKNKENSHSANSILLFSETNDIKNSVFGKNVELYAEDINGGKTIEKFNIKSIKLIMGNVRYSFNNFSNDGKETEYLVSTNGDGYRIPITVYLSSKEELEEIDKVLNNNIKECICEVELFSKINNGRIQKDILFMTFDLPTFDEDLPYVLIKYSYYN